MVKFRFPGKQRRRRNLEFIDHDAEAALATGAFRDDSNFSQMPEIQIVGKFKSKHRGGANGAFRRFW
jgi:hypothetical protein